MSILTRSSTGHQGRYGHEFLGTLLFPRHLPQVRANLSCNVEFDFRADGTARYANNSNYRNDSLIRKESTVPLTINVFERFVDVQCASHLP